MSHERLAAVIQMPVRGGPARRAFEAHTDPPSLPLDMELPPDNGDRRPICSSCQRRPADVRSNEDAAWCGSCALALFGAFAYDSLLGEKA